MKPGSSPSTAHWQEMEPPMPIFGVSLTSFLPHYHPLYVTPCVSKKMLAFTAQRHYVRPDTSVYDPRATFLSRTLACTTNTDVSNPTPACRFQHLRFEPNAVMYSPTLHMYNPMPACMTHHLHFEPNVGVYSSTPGCRAQRQRTADGEDLARIRWH